MATINQQITPTFTTNTMSGQPPQGSNAAPNSQTPGHPSFRRYVGDYYKLNTRFADNSRLGNEHPELAR